MDVFSQVLRASWTEQWLPDSYKDLQKLFLTFFPDVDLRLEPVAEEGLGLVVAELVDGLAEVVVQVLQQLVVLLVHLQRYDVWLSKALRSKLILWGCVTFLAIWWQSKRMRERGREREREWKGVQAGKEREREKHKTKEKEAIERRGGKEKERERGKERKGKRGQ